jgi:DUF4097 and DUF4098 domain-containing protein YvlB
MLTVSTILSPWVLGVALLSPAPASAAMAAPSPAVPVAPIVAPAPVAAPAPMPGVQGKDKDKDKDKEKDKDKDKDQDRDRDRDRDRTRERNRDRDHGAEQTERLSRTFPVGANGSLFLNNIAGNIEIKGGPGNEIRVDALKHGRGSSDDDARGQVQNIQVTMNEVSGRVEVKTYHSGRNSRGWVDFIITVPTTIRVEVQSVSGDLQLHNIKGELRGETVSGDVTGSGLGRVTSLKTMSGDVRINGVDSDAAVVLSALSGDMTIENLKARSVEANSISGGVTLKGCACGRVHLESVSGDLEYVGQIEKAGRYEIKTHSGGIRLAVPAMSGFEVDANSFSGDISFDPPITSIMSQGRGRGPGRLAHGVIGNGGAFVELSSFSGDIVVNRGGK